ncbi:MAG: ornithine carbamoyltransferase [Planctomycetota bacterium]|nr:ornithine carbamoyltransferase [Planctomycetota bacterium]
MKDFVNIADFSGEQLKSLLKRAIADKELFRAGRLPATCIRKVLAIVFEKPSLRTRVSFEAAIVQLGGAAINLTEADIGLGKREPVSDVATVLGGMCDAVTARTFSHDTVLGLAEYCSAPVINALTDYCHPCQAMADAMTATEIFGDLAGRKLAFIGDGNNVARSLATLCAKLEMEFAIACPEGYELQGQFEGNVTQTRDPREAVADASIIYTDTWVSMGQEDEKDERIAVFKPYQVNAELLAAAPSDAVVMHCLPAYRGYEITDEVMSAHAETIFAEAENRLHFQRTLLHVLVAEGGIN